MMKSTRSLQATLALRMFSLGWKQTWSKSWKDKVKEMPLFANMDKNTVYGEGPSADQYIEMAQQLISTLGSCSL